MPMLFEGDNGSRDPVGWVQPNEVELVGDLSSLKISHGVEITVGKFKAANAKQIVESTRHKLVLDDGKWGIILIVAVDAIKKEITFCGRFSYGRA